VLFSNLFFRALTSGLNSMGSMGGYAMGMNSLDGSMGMMGMSNGGLSLG
jgi:hypothetical protein